MNNNLVSKVRLKEFEILAIQECCAKYFASDDHLWLFGSRANMAKYGGDIDLYIETSLPASKVYQAKSDFLNTLCEKIGDQKIDLVVHILQDQTKLPIYAVAKSEGVKIV